MDKRCDVRSAYCRVAMREENKPLVSVAHVGMEVMIPCVDYFHGLRGEPCHYYFSRIVIPRLRLALLWHREMCEVGNQQDSRGSYRDIPNLGIAKRHSQPLSGRASLHSLRLAS